MSDTGRMWGALAQAAIMALALGTSSAHAAEPIRVGEINSYKAQPAFLEPYRQGWQLALEQVNAAGGVQGRPLEVISRDDNGNPGDSVRVAEELRTREKVELLFGGFLSNTGLALTDYAKQRRMFFLAAEPLTDKITWAQGNRYTFRLRPSTYMQVAALIPEAAKLQKTRWAIVYPNYEYGQSALNSFKSLLKAQQPDVEFVAEVAAPLGKVDAGAVVQALADAKPDAIFNILFATDLTRFVREGETRGLFEGREVVSLLTGEPEYMDALGADAPEGWLITGYPWYAIDTPYNQRFVADYRARFNDYPRLGSVVGYASLMSIAEGLKKAGGTDTDALVEAFRGLTLDSPFGPITYRALDHQSTMGVFVGRSALQENKGVMVDFQYRDGATLMPPDEEVRRLRPAAD
ncbi:ABC transporter substrate-binding protein [Achromobacter sp. GG226]|uniref:ABC transporter substrate-binding protein n=1 Tax=Verticiella alkaliphila TaxID=2779529 RepID=UPI001C0DCAF2|nr:ABC transporter substrate-binding protein [Verticiella sp. GG226]MBU4612765.1 ABC transporter substrate-binding protein [Verticiella sp. GG226]